ncbi:PD-(D/E)XK nuclease family protein [Methanobacterium alcaliphilum]|uniref:PD-(D/E)XK nuclease family protein n=1 Tax=Methanobacterium alcaliphilum TaxID=392018 RepID=UPI00200A59AA|nr:PD-(D/E)XK nuclease family protein [Methanobacterium alcaliphilum]MCK9151804.1 PD-(D/E)XK nuclease family protein [Methanobacterium alcaliphilum]
MYLSKRSKPFVIPEYSLTGDLLTYLSCGLKYRYHNKGSLPPSKPVQLWFGEFIHSVLEEAYLVWRDNGKKSFPWDWNDNIREIEIEIYRRLLGKGLSPPLNLFCPHDETVESQGLCSNNKHPHKLIASKRVEASINTWGPHLFPLIDEAEIKLKGTRNIPNHLEKISRSPYYGIKGVADVISSVNINKIPPGNLILSHINQNEDVLKILDTLNTPEYEIIIDYKGMSRPASDSDSCLHHEWQILTYAWLRSKQPNAKKITAGIIFYINELIPSLENFIELKEDVLNEKTDVEPRGFDLKAIKNWKKSESIPELSGQFKEKRSIRIIPITEDRIKESLNKFDEVVGEIEMCVYMESNNRGINSSWRYNPIERNCTVCDFKTYCPNPAPSKYRPTVP